MFKTVQDAARVLAIEDSQRKAFILISEGQAVDVLGLFDTMTARVPLDSLQNPKEVAWHDYALLDMMDALRRANATLYAIDPRGRLQTSEERSQGKPWRERRPPHVRPAVSLAGGPEADR